MIVEFDKTGTITHLVFDPVPEGLIEIMRKNGATFLDLSPIPLPDIPALDEDGEPRFETTYDQIFDEHNNAVLSEDGSPLIQVIHTPVMQTGRFEYASVDISSDYVDNDMVLKRPVFSSVPANADLVWGGSDLVINDLPKPCTVTLDGEKHIVEDGTLTLGADVIADYELTFEAWPHVSTTMKVKVHAPAA